MEFSLVLVLVHTGWSKSRATHIKICIDGCNSIQLHWINKHTILLWLYKSPRRWRHVTCSRQSVSCLQTVEVQGRLFHKCIECSLSNTTWHLVLTCQNEFRDTFPDSSVPNKSTVSRLVNRFRDTGSVQVSKSSGRPSVLSDDSLDDIRQTLLCSLSLRKHSLQSGLSYWCT
jgi:hypothetical protein